MTHRAIKSILLLVFLAFVSPAIASTDCVILLHGLARGTGTWNNMEPVLRRAGYGVVNQKYPSTQNSIESLAAAVVPTALEKCGQYERVHFVTHSMGGIILRQYLATNSVDNLGRAVMIAPPNKGSAIVDRFGDLAAFGWINGPAGAQLGSTPDSLPNRLGPADFELGVIAGSRSYSPLFSNIIPGRDDGKVSIESTKLEGMAEHIVVSAGHTFIAMKPKTVRLTLAFLRTGSFASAR